MRRWDAMRAKQVVRANIRPVVLQEKRFLANFDSLVPHFYFIHLRAPSRPPCVDCGPRLERHRDENTQENEKIIRTLILLCWMQVEICTDYEIFSLFLFSASFSLCVPSSVHLPRDGPQSAERKSCFFDILLLAVNSHRFRFFARFCLLNR